MREAIVAEAVVEVGVSVEVEDGERLGAAGRSSIAGPIATCVSAQDRIGDRVVAAEDERTARLREDLTDALFNGVAGRRGIVAKFEVAGVVEDAISREVVAALVPGVARRRPQRLADQWRCSSGATLKA
jgi:hypothetical protein